MKVRGFAVHRPGEELRPWSGTRRRLGSKDVAIEIEWSGVCHSDIHTGRAEWADVKFPCVPGHEILGRVTAVGEGVSKFALDARVGVGVYVDSCRVCEPCVQGLSNYCVDGIVATYDSPQKNNSGYTFGGYSSGIIVDENYVVPIPPQLDPSRTAPLLCAGITLYSPLKNWNVGPGVRLGIVGFGGLGHLGLKFAKALGAEVAIFSQSPAKKQDAISLGADDFFDSSDDSPFRSQQKSFDLIINTVSASIDLNRYLELLRLDGTLIMVGLAPEPYPIRAFSMLSQRRRIAGTMIGPISELEEMLEFAAKNEISADVEIIPASYLNQAWDRVVSGDVRYRFVVDGSTFVSS